MERVEIGNAVLWHADCSSLDDDVLKADAVVTDPPYGMKWDTNSARYSGGQTTSGRGRGRYWKPVHNDDVAFSPLRWLDYNRVVLFGANHYANDLPLGTTLVWIKRYRFGTFLSDAEIAWMKGGHGVYCHQDASMNGAGANFPKEHPTQKPVGLMSWCLDRANVPDNGVVLDPYMGSGSTGVACIKAGLKFIGVEYEREYFDSACNRIAEAQRQGKLAI